MEVESELYGTGTPRRINTCDILDVYFKSLCGSRLVPLSELTFKPAFEIGDRVGYGGSIGTIVGIDVLDVMHPYRVISPDMDIWVDESHITKLDQTKTNDFKVGDRVWVKQYTVGEYGIDERVPVAEFGTIIGTKSPFETQPYDVKLDDGKHYVLNEAEMEEATHEFKVGDRVRVLDTIIHTGPMIGVITEVDNTGYYKNSIRVREDDSCFTAWCKPCNSTLLRVCDPSHECDVVKQKFKDQVSDVTHQFSVGDLVFAKQTTSNRVHDQVVKITDLYDEHGRYKVITSDGDTGITRDEYGGKQNLFSIEFKGE
jgi:ribosomal protein L19